MEDLEKMAAALMAMVRDMPPGQQRQDALKEIGRLRFRMDTLLRSASQPPAKGRTDCGGKEKRLISCDDKTTANG